MSYMIYGMASRKVHRLVDGKEKTTYRVIIRLTVCLERRDNGGLVQASLVIHIDLPTNQLTLADRNWMGSTGHSNPSSRSDGRKRRGRTMTLT